MKKRIVFATNNEHKLSEVRQILGDEFEVLSLADIGCHEDIPETGQTLKDNALQKAEYVFNKYGMDCFADDTGLEVEALDGAPGVHTARYAAECGFTDKDHDSTANVDCLLHNLKDKENRHAHFCTIIALMRHPEDKDESNHVSFYTGIVEGIITPERRGEQGFGYDPIFQPDGYDKTFAELGVDVKNQISHRARAVAKLANALKG